MIEKQSKISIIRMFHVHKNYGAAKALIDITLDVPKNELLFISGPSGAGKTSLLKLLYFGEAVSEGQVLIDGMNLSRISHNRIPILRRKFGVIFQDYKLIPTKTVFDNIYLEVKTAYLRTQEAERAIKTVEKAIEQAKENFRINQERYKEQISTQTDVLIAQTLLSRTMTNYYNALYAFKISKATLYRTIGQEVIE